MRVLTEADFLAWMALRATNECQGDEDDNCGGGGSIRASAKAQQPHVKHATLPPKYQPDVRAIHFTHVTQKAHGMGEPGVAHAPLILNSIPSA